MLSKHSRLFMIVAVCAAAFSAAPCARSQDVAEAARKAKAKKQQQQADVSPSSTSAKPKTYSNDDFPESGGSASPGGASAGQDVVGSSEKPAAGKDTAVVLLSLSNSTIKRQGGVLAFWSVKNTSDHWLDLRINLIVNGPCGYHTEHPVQFRLSNGGGFGNKKSMGVSFYPDDCAGEYTFELRAESFHNTLSTATTTLKVL